MKHAGALVVFEVPGPPLGKGRHRSFINDAGRQVHVADAKTGNYEGMLKWYARQAMGKAGVHVPLDEPLWMHVTAFMQPPAAESRRWERARLLLRFFYAAKKPDWDNIGKIVSDGLNGVLYRDDALIVDGRVVKRYDLNPRMVVSVGRFVDSAGEPCQNAAASQEVGGE